MVAFFVVINKIALCSVKIESQKRKREQKRKHQKSIFDKMKIISIE